MDSLGIISHAHGSNTVRGSLNGADLRVSARRRAAVLNGGPEMGRGTARVLTLNNLGNLQLSSTLVTQFTGGVQPSSATEGVYFPSSCISSSIRSIFVRCVNGLPPKAPSYLTGKSQTYTRNGRLEERFSSQSGDQYSLDLWVKVCLIVEFAAITRLNV